VADIPTWQWLDTGFGSGAFNMRCDESLARRLSGGPFPSILRFYRWKPWAISVGYNQGTAGVDAGRCEADGIDIVRRPTGGRAILHSEELTYSVVMYAGRRSVLQVYNDISRALVRGLHLFGVDVVLQRLQPDFPEEYRRASSIPCFTSAARYEIEWDGRKLVGSAQRRFNDGEQDIVLQHGSILCGPAHRRLVDYLRLADPVQAEQLRKELTDKTVDLREITGGAVDVPVLVKCLRQGFEEEWGVQFEAADIRHILQTNAYA
jgi:lipoate-protein ligase A